MVLARELSELCWTTRHAGAEQDLTGVVADLQVQLGLMAEMLQHKTREAEQGKEELLAAQWQMVEFTKELERARGAKEHSMRETVLQQQARAWAELQGTNTFADMFSERKATLLETPGAPAPDTSVRPLYAPGCTASARPTCTHTDAHKPTHTHTHESK